jgi:hypothetical protein
MASSNTSPKFQLIHRSIKTAVKYQLKFDGSGSHLSLSDLSSDDANTCPL